MFVARTVIGRSGFRLAFLALMLGSHAAAADVPVVAAASDLKFALEEVASSFRKQSGRDLKITFGSSGIFATQIRNGAPFQMYLSADEEYVQKLHLDGLTRDIGVLYAIGRIVLVTPINSPLPVDAELKGVAALLKQGKLQHFAIANPEHAPYGRRAEEALKHAGLWDALKPKLVLGENVSQAAQFAIGGSAEGGIVALSLAKAPQMAKLGRYAVIPAEWHTPLRQRMVLLNNAGATAQAFYAYMQQPAARKIMRGYGFLLPGEVE
ncbi:MAG: molybdate ABC transporter substrate-binding protein [Oxalobacteraceae bacterium]|nr:molybdate ABC transporter substrate-binding protein [Oxalobacteraceae bacterium]